MSGLLDSILSPTEGLRAPGPNTAPPKMEEINYMKDV